MITNKETVIKITALYIEDGAKIEIENQCNVIKECSWSIKDETGKILLDGKESIKGSKISFSAKFNAKAWSVESPNLYRFEANLIFDDNSVEKVSDCFGFRYFDCDEKNIYLNGYPFYMRAYIRGAAAHEHQNNCNLSEYEFYKKNIMMAKSYGFNTIRFHSVVPPEECFRAADELGILIHIEMRADKQVYDNLEEMRYGKNNFVTNEELIQIIHSLYNHPSFMVYCVGNEIRQPGKKPRIKEIREFIKKHDPNRLFIDTCAHGEYDRDYVDFDVQHMGYFFPYGKHADMFENTDNLLCFGSVSDNEMIAEYDSGKIRRAISFSRPLIAHEVCHYTSWRDFYALKKKFEEYHRPLPWWVDEEIKMIEAKGYDKNFKDTLQITKDYQFRCWKTALESIRASELLSGFHMLQFADTDKYENSNGIVDCFDDPHGISPEEFRKFNSDSVILARLPKQIFSCGENAKIPILFSQYMINPPETAVFTYKLYNAEGRVYSEGMMENMSTIKSGLYKICGLDLEMPMVTKPQKMILSCSLKFVDDTICENTWELWVFPQADKLSVDANNNMQASYLNRVCNFNTNAKLTITDKLDDDLFAMLEDGKDVLLLYRSDWTRHLLNKEMKPPQYAFRAVWERYKGVIWDRGTINGGPDNKEILNKYGFVTDGQINFQYYPLIEDCDKIILDEFPVKADVLVGGLDKCSRDRFDPQIFKLPELMYDRTMRRFGYVFALRVGNGRLMVAGLNFTGVDYNNPASCAMLNTLVNYCNSDDFTPKSHISVTELKEYLIKSASSGPQKERMMTQYWQLDAEPVESMQYWEGAECYLRDKDRSDLCEN